MTDFTPRLAEFATAPLDIPADTLTVLRFSMLDWLAVGRAGASEPVSKILREMALHEAGAPQSTLFGDAQKTPARAAALVNGTTSHALDYDDTHFAHIGHPSVAVVSAAMAVGEQAGASLQAVQDAALMGIELSIRVGLWLGRDHYQVGFHQTATAGAFGAAAAAGRLLGLNAVQMEHVLGLTATRAAGLKAQFGTMGKPYNAGQAAANGVEAAQLVNAGFQSNPGALDGDFGFGATHSGAANTDALDGLGTDWLFDSVSHKFHACCHGLHAALEALQARKPVAVDQIAAITVRTHSRWLSVCNQPAPDTGLGAKFSYATVLPMSLYGYDTAKLDSFSEATCADPKLQALRQKVAVTGDDTLTETQSTVTITLNDGSHQSMHHDLLKPMPLDARQHRVRAKAAALLGTQLENAVWEVLNSPGDLSRFSAFMS
jgi:2-methylcitrate dehydratase PrpD